MNEPNHNPLEQLKNDYQQIPIPKELDTMIKNTLEQEASERRRQNRLHTWRNTALTAAAVAAVFIASINLSPTVATALANVPGLGTLVEVFTFGGYTVEENNFEANIAIPQVSGLDPAITELLNQKYLAEGQALYDEFKADMDAVKEEFPDAHMGLDYNYEIKTNDDRVFSLSRYVVNTVGSSSTEVRYDTVDKKTQTIVTLPSLFTDGADYVTLISDHIKAQMRQQMAADESLVYWLDDEEIPDENFTAIAPDQEFYINPDGQLVICFDKYAVAPGYMGAVQFVIPTDVLAPILSDTGLLR